MFLCSADASGRILSISYSGRVGVEEVNRRLEAVQKIIDGLNPGFVLLVDVSHLDWMDPDCAPEIGAIMDACNSKGLSSVVRVVPDKTKDIGFNLISRFHYSPNIAIRTCETTADGISSLFSDLSRVDALAGAQS